MSTFWPDWSVLHFIRPDWLWLCAGALLVLGGAILRERLARQAFGGGVEPHLLAHLVIPPGRRAWLRPAPLTAVAVALGAVAAAGPTWREEPSPFTQDKAPLVIVLESSWTMNAIDIQPTRLARAKDKIRLLLRQRANARTALIVYAGSSHLVMPFTDDAAAIELFLPGLDPSIMPRPGDDPATAVAMADAMLVREPVPGSILLISDGVPAPQVQQLARPVARRQLLVLGVGTSAGGPIRTGENRFQTGPGGARTIARLDKQSLETLGSEADAFVATITMDDRDITRIQRNVQRHMAAVEAAEREARWIDAGYYLVFPLIALAAITFRRGWTVRWALVALLVVAPSRPIAAQEGDTRQRPFRFIDLWLTADQQGRRAYERGDFKTAAALFDDPMWKGLASYRTGDLAAAASAWSRVESPEANYDRGNALARLGEYKLAVAAYDQALAARPDFAAARANRERVVRAMRKPAPDEEEQEEGPNIPPDKVVFDDKGEKGKKGKMQMPTQRELVTDAWLKSVQASPGEFLRMRFAAEVSRRP
jgi:Ca-activated chloride channel family protein